MTRPSTKPLRSARASAIPHQSSSPAAIWQSLALLAVAYVGYHNSFTGPFVFDDVINIRNNLKMRQLWPIWQSMWGPLSTGVAGRPVVQLSFALNFAVHELSVTGYHVTNLVLHVLTALLLFAILRHTLGLLPKFRGRASLLGFVTTLLWEIHPLLSDSVTYLSGRTEILGALFMLLTLYCAIRAMRDGSRRRTMWQIAAVAACALGTGCKEILAAAPFLVLLYDWLFVAKSFREALRARWRMYVGLAATLALIPLNLYMANFHRSALVGQEQLSSWTYLKVQSEVLALYLRLSLWPHPLIIDYAGWPTHRTFVQVLPSALLIAGLLITTGYLLARRRPAGYVGAWFFLILAPTSSLLPLPTEIATERRMYLPLMAIVALVVLSGYRLLQYSRARWPAAAQAIGYVAGIVILLTATAEAARTVIRNDDFKDPVSLWQDVIRHRPRNARAYDNLGYEYVGRAQPGKAKESFARAIEIEPTDYTALNSLAKLYVDEGKDDDALRYLEASIRVKPDQAVAYVNLATIQQHRGRFADAERSSRESIRIASGRTDNRIALIRALVAQGRGDEAEHEARATVALAPSSTPARDALALALASGGRVREAVDEWNAIVAAGTGDSDAAWHLAWYLASAEDPSLRNPKRAVAAARSAATATSASEVGPLDAMALALAAEERFDQAETVAQGALDIAKPRGYFVAAAIERRLASYRQRRMPGREDLRLLP